MFSVLGLGEYQRYGEIKIALDLEQYLPHSENSMKNSCYFLHIISVSLKVQSSLFIGQAMLRFGGEMGREMYPNPSPHQ